MCVAVPGTLNLDRPIDIGYASSIKVACSLIASRRHPRIDAASRWLLGGKLPLIPLLRLLFQLSTCEGPHPLPPSWRRRDNGRHAIKQLTNLALRTLFKSSTTSGPYMPARPLPLSRFFEPRPVVHRPTSRNLETSSIDCATNPTTQKQSRLARFFTRRLQICFHVIETVCTVHSP